MGKDGEPKSAAQIADKSAEAATAPTSPGSSEPPEAEAEARLHQLREEAGGAVSGRELARRFGLQDDAGSDEPPLDWRLTPRNVILQILGVVAFGAAIWFLGSLFFGGFATLFSGAG